MPLIIPNGLPAAEALQSENIFTMNRGRAVTQDIRPLKIVIVNLMPVSYTHLTDVNILENVVKTRLIVEEGSKDKDSEEKLSAEIYNYKKDDIKRFGKKNNRKREDELANLEDDVLKEIKELMKD